jgi:hypothetical protein
VAFRRRRNRRALGHRDEAAARDVVVGGGQGVFLGRAAVGNGALVARSGADVGEEDLSDARGLFQSGEVSGVVKRDRLRSRKQRKVASRSGTRDQS